MPSVRKKRAQNKQINLRNKENRKEAARTKYWKNPDKQRARCWASYWENLDKGTASSRVSSYTRYWEDPESKRASFHTRYWTQLVGDFSGNLTLMLATIHHFI